MFVQKIKTIPTVIKVMLRHLYFTKWLFPGLPAEGQVRQPILVATCHVHWDPEYSDVKLIQTMMLMHELRNIIQDNQTSLRPGSQTPDCNAIPLILCGDLNSLPESGMYSALASDMVFSQ